MSGSHIIALGINYRTTPVELREKLAFADSQIPEAARTLQQLPGLQETVVLSTCNRVELYAGHSGDSAPDQAIERLRDYLVQHFQLSAAQAAALITYQPVGREAARHLFRVVSGLDSMVLGETEIFGQTKQAYKVALEAGTTGKLMNQLFQRAFSVGKMVRERTSIQRGSTSVGSVAVDLAAKLFDLKSCRVMLIGAGDMARVCAQSLQSRGAQSVIVSNRNFERAQELAVEMKGKALRFDEWENALTEVDVIISSTSAPHFVVTKPLIERTLKLRKYRPLFLIDIAVPRDVDPAVNELSDVYLYDIDQLSAIAEDGRKERQRQIDQCETIIEEQLTKFGF
jgi:glutamyl-tRNA reductase